MVKGLLHTHYLVVTLFLLIYVIKTILLISDKKELLDKFTKKFRVPEMIISTLFLLTGIYLSTQLPFGGKYDYLFWMKIAMVAVAIPLAIVGFKKSNKILAALSLLLITGTYGVAEVYHKRKGIPKQGNEMLSDAKALYENNCSSCHGDNGKLGGSGSKDLSKTQLDLAGINQIITQGKGMMSPASQLSPEQAQIVAEYVNSSIKGQ